MPSYRNRQDVVHHRVITPAADQSRPGFGAPTVTKAARSVRLLVHRRRWRSRFCTLPPHRPAPRTSLFRRRSESCPAASGEWGRRNKRIRRTPTFAQAIGIITGAATGRSRCSLSSIIEHRARCGLDRPWHEQRAGHHFAPPCWPVVRAAGLLTAARSIWRCSAAPMRSPLLCPLRARYFGTTPAR